MLWSLDCKILSTTVTRKRVDCNVYLPKHERRDVGSRDTGSGRILTTISNDICLGLAQNLLYAVKTPVGSTRWVSAM